MKNLNHDLVAWLIVKSISRSITSHLPIPQPWKCICRLQVPDLHLQESRRVYPVRTFLVCRYNPLNPCSHLLLCSQRILVGRIDPKSLLLSSQLSSSALQEESENKHTFNQLFLQSPHQYSNMKLQNFNLINWGINDIYLWLNFKFVMFGKGNQLNYHKNSNLF